MNQTFRVEKQNIYNVDHTQTQLAPLEEGAVRLKIELFAFTSNNVTYAVTGFKLKYWNFFPTEEPYGIIPVWGYGEVVASNHSVIQVGERYYGYFPMSTFLDVQPTKINAYGFTDNQVHRRDLAPIYNHYMNVSADPAYNDQIANYLPIIKPLFATSFLIYHFLKKQDFINADQILLTGASSKTSLALAFMLKQHQAVDGKNIIGLTSAGNVDFVQATNYYDTVFTYEHFAQIKSQQSVIVDISGNYNRLQQLSDYLNDQLQHIVLVGLTDWKSSGKFSNIPKTKFFFAPTHLQQFYEAFGVGKATQMLNKALVKFIKDMSRYIKLELVTDRDTLCKLYVHMVDGKVDPQKGYIVKI